MLTTIKEYAFKIHKNTPTPHTQKIKQGGARQSWIRLCLYTIDFLEIIYHYTLNCEDAAFTALIII